ncbi:hypothetical protein SPHV1_2400020 [Novosphingobium sp. KN65.2]|nr:hypothetical protein SPHV1_2400020 [Novosphingobium sp. KN65.2]
MRPAGRLRIRTGNGVGSFRGAPGQDRGEGVCLIGVFTRFRSQPQTATADFGLFDHSCRIRGDRGLEFPPEFWREGITGKLDALLSGALGQIFSAFLASSLTARENSRTQHLAQDRGGLHRGIVPGWKAVRREHAATANAQNVGRAKLLCSSVHCAAPGCGHLPVELLQALVATGKVRQNAVDPGRVEAAHRLHRQATQLVAFIEQRRDYQQPRFATAIEAEGMFVDEATGGQRTGPARRCHRRIRPRRAWTW